MQDSDVMQDIVELENSFVSDVAKIMRENWSDLTAEQQRDLVDFELGKIDFDTLFSKYWNEDGTCKDQLAGLEDMFRSLGFGVGGAATQDNAEFESSDSSSSNDDGAQTDTEEASDDDTAVSDHDHDVEMDTAMNMDVDMDVD